MTNIVLVNRDLLMVHSVFRVRRGVMISDYVEMMSNNSVRGRFLFREAAAAGNTNDDDYEHYDEDY